jgi:hypothetical protein
MGIPKAKRVTVQEWAATQVCGVVALDFETFYSSTYSVSQMGNWAYVHDPRFKAWAVSVSDGARTCVCTPVEFPWGTIVGREWVSHNREFDEAVFLRLVELGLVGTGAEGTPRPTSWHCSAAACAFLQLPRDLAGACRAVFDVVVDKSERKRAKGRDCGPDLFGQSEEGAAYAATDAEMSLALWQVLEKHWPAHERRLFDLTCEMGRHGVWVDWGYVEACRSELRATVDSLAAALPWRPALSIPRFAEACDAAGVPRPASTAASDPEFQDWAHANQRNEVVTWARHMQRIRSANRTAKVLEGMRLRRIQDSEFSIQEGENSDTEGTELRGVRRGGVFGLGAGRMAYELKYFGASTGRWSGGGGLNMQNYNRKPAEGVDLRRAIAAPSGHRLAVVDYCQIESRVLLYLAGDVAALDLFRANPDSDAYEIHARATMGWVPDGTGEKAEDCRLKEETLKEYCARTGSGIRQLAKARVLGLGFGCGARRFIEVAKVMAGLDICEDDSERIVSEFRASNPKIVRLWQSLNDACASCDGGEYRLPLPCTQGNPALGRFLIYRDVVAGKDGIECTIGGERTPVYGGLIAENWTQATARDVLASAWLRCDAAGYRPVLSVHDELVFEVPAATAAADLARIVAIFEQPMSWAPGLPLRADGKLCDVYGK